MGEQATIEPAAPVRSLNRWAAAVIGLALIPVFWVFYGTWYSNALYENGDVPRGIFYIGTSLCLVGIYAIILFIIKPAPNGLLIPLSTCPTGPPLSRARAILAGLLILVSTAWAGWIMQTAFISRELPGVELLLCLLAHWFGWLLRRPGEMKFPARLLGWLFPYLLFLCAGILSLFWIYSHAQFQLWFLFPVVGAGIFLWPRRKEVPVIAWLVLLALALYTYRLDHWLYAAVGDDYIFLEYAQEITRMSGLIINKSLYNCCFVYGQHPFISSLLQAGWMKLFGAANFGWRSLNPVLCALSLPLLYSFFKTFVDRRVAVTTIALLAVSAYLMNFSKIGYNNLSAFFGQAVVLAAAAWALREESPAAFVGLALAGGLCVYLYPAALYILAVAILLLLIFRPPVTPRRLLLWGLAAGIFFIMASPMLLQPQVIPVRVIGTYYWSPELRDSPAALLRHTAVNFVMALFSNFHTPSESHFVAAGYLDPLSAGLSLPGLAIAASWLRRERFARFGWLAFLLMLFLVGTSHDRSTPSTTRMFTLLPWFALFAALGLEWVLRWFKAAPTLRWIILSVILLTNFNQAYHLALTRKTNFQLLNAMFIKLATHLEKASPGQERVYLFLSEANWDPYGLREIQKVYPQFLRHIRVDDLDMSETVLPQLTTRAHPVDTYVIIHPSLDRSWTDRINQPLLAAGKQKCIQRTDAGEARFTVWYTPDARFPNGPCYPAVWKLPEWVLWAVGLALTVVLDAAWVLWRRKRKKMSGIIASLTSVLG